MENISLKLNLLPEERAEIRIGCWLMENGIEVFSNRIGKATTALRCGVFNTSGINKKPDMIFKCGDEYYALEIKSGVGGKNTRGVDKIINYYMMHKNGETKYYICGLEVQPTIFLCGSYFSPDGMLFEHDQPKPSRHTLKERRLFGCPDFEYWETHTFLRTLWDDWKKVKDKRYCLGILLSDKLNYGIGKPTPMVFIQNYNDILNKWSPPHSCWMLNKNGRYRV